ncbi:hypothetical protein D3C80_2194140 [compost metagenome]
MQFTLRIDQVAVHRGATFLATTLRAQRVGFGVITFQNVENFVLWHQVNSGFATLFWR